MQGIKGETTVAEICRNHGISQVQYARGVFNTPEAYQYYKWRDLFLQEAKEHLSGKSNKNGSIVDKEKIKELERIIGKQTVTIVPLTAG